MRKATSLLAIAPAIAVLGSPPSASAIDIAPSKKVVGTHGEAFVPYKASHPLEEPDRKITRVVLSIHSSSFDALQYFENADKAAGKRGVSEETLIIAPHFLHQGRIPGKIPDKMIFWRSPPYRGSSRAAIGPKVKKISLSAYEVIDRWLADLTKGGPFPNLRDIVLVGHSAGGQLVQRYALVGKFAPPSGVRIRYVVSAPSSFAYVSGERFDPARRAFAIPDKDLLSDCPKYNHWGYGLTEPYAYFRKSDVRSLARDYARKSVFYLCGSRDTKPDDPSLSKTCAAMMQGADRLERMRVFERYLRHTYGSSVQRTHRFAVVAGVGHHGLGTMTSKAGLSALFDPLP